MNLVYLSLDQAVEVHLKTIKVSGGGALGQLELHKLESVLAHIQNDDYYPSFSEKLTHLFFCACKFHCFLDGNKRIAITLCAQMLLNNGYLYCVGRFLREMENISYHVAAGSIGKELLHEIITAFLDEREDEEALKLKILHAIAEKDHETAL